MEGVWTLVFTLTIFLGDFYSVNKKLWFSDIEILWAVHLDPRIHTFHIFRVKFGVPLDQVCKRDIPGPLLVSDFFLKSTKNLDLVKSRFCDFMILWAVNHMCTQIHDFTKGKSSLQIRYSRTFVGLVIF